jgi:hypothetical protein
LCSEKKDEHEKKELPGVMYSVFTKKGLTDQKRRKKE